MASDEPVGARAYWPVSRLVALIALPVLSGGAVLAWSRGLLANLILASLASLWMIGVVAQGLRRERRSATAPPQLPMPADDARERRRLNAYLNLSPVPLVTLEEGYRLRAVNRAARRLFRSEDVVPDPPETLSAAIARTAPGRSATLSIERDDGDHVYALATADLVVAGPATRIAALVDIDAELRAAQAGALRDLLQILSHEIMNALTPIASLSRSAADLLDDDTQAQVRDAVETVARRAEGLQRFTSAYRDLARLPAPSPRAVASGPMIADIRRLFATRWPHVAFEVQDKRAPNIIQVDRDQFDAALWALLQNAAEAVADRADGQIGIAVEAVENATRFTVTDNGPGIAKADRASIFRPFFTTKRNGSGVGLALVRQIVDAHHGRIDLLSEGEGAAFQIILPSDL